MYPANKSTSRHFGGGSKNNTCKTIKGSSMTTRRHFLKSAAATGIAFCSCGMLAPARAQPKPPRLPVKVGGKRVMTVDVHSHCYFRESLNLMGDAAQKILPPVKGVPEHFIVIEQRLKEMDAMAIDMEILSINPFWYGKDRDTAAAIVKLQNEKLAELCAATRALRGVRLADPAVSGSCRATA
jgi:aminocarboxymuconate-semialdehyde decarboxylase